MTLPVKPKKIAIGNRKYILPDNEILFKQSKTKNSEITNNNDTPMPMARRFFVVKILENNDETNDETAVAIITKKCRCPDSTGMFKINMEAAANVSMNVKNPVINAIIQLLIGFVLVFDFIFKSEYDIKKPPYLLKDMKVLFILLLNYSSYEFFFERFPLPFSAFSASFAAA